jgi:thioredoxin reductase/ferredoxin
VLATTLVWLVLTGAFIWWQLRKDQGGATPSAAVRHCPRCQTPVPEGASVCRQCGVGLQILEVVAAPMVLDAPAAAGGKPRALVRADLCVGCGTCAASCPEDGAITLRGKLAVVDDARCQGHGECVAACPVGAISVTTGTAANRVAVPLVDGNFETNVSGLYIVGELGGRGLIRNAVNEGKVAMEHVARALPRAARGRAGAADLVDVAIVGAGPAGLSAGLEAMRQRLRYVVLEQGSLAETVRKYPRHKLLLAGPLQIPVYGDLWVADASKEELLRVWETVVAETGLEVRTGEKVEDVVRDGDIFRLVTTAGTHRARRIVLAMGRRGSPRRLGVPGEELEKVLYDIVEMEAFRGRRVVVVGGGDSAVESALGLANQEGTEVHLSYRGDGFARVKERNRAHLDAAVTKGTVRLLLGTQVREVRREVVVLEGPEGSAIVPNDYVIVRIGGEAPGAFLERLGVQIVQKDVPLPADVPRAG